MGNQKSHRKKEVKTSACKPTKIDNMKAFIWALVFATILVAYTCRATATPCNDDERDDDPKRNCGDCGKSTPAVPASLACGSCAGWCNDCPGCPCRRRKRSPTAQTCNECNGSCTGFCSGCLGCQK